MIQKPKALLFDLGGVIVPWIGIAEAAKLSGKTEGDFLDLLLKASFFKEFETGQITIEEFAPLALSHFDIDIPRQEFEPLWNSWVLEPYIGTREAMIKLSKKFQIACLSNTNHSHWDYLTENLNIIDVFDPAIASHNIGLSKPDSQAWITALSLMQKDASDVWFFDDTLANVKAAQALGIRSFHIDKSTGALPVLKELGLL